jgi:putative endonuclease
MDKTGAFGNRVPVFVFCPAAMPKNKAHIEKGRQGEALAVRFLEQKGWQIAAQNWRAGRGEIDIIAWAAERLLVFVEVKTRSYDAFGGPEDAVNARKQDLLLRTAGRYMESIDYDWEIRFDIVAIILDKFGKAEIRHIEDAFFGAS